MPCPVLGHFSMAVGASRCSDPQSHCSIRPSSRRKPMRSVKPSFPSVPCLWRAYGKPECVSTWTRREPSTAGPTCRPCPQDSTTGCRSSAPRSRKKLSVFRESSSTSIRASAGVDVPHASGITCGSASDLSFASWKRECGEYRNWSKGSGWWVRLTSYDSIDGVTRNQEPQRHQAVSAISKNVPHQERQRSQQQEPRHPGITDGSVRSRQIGFSLPQHEYGEKRGGVVHHVVERGQGQDLIEGSAHNEPDAGECRDP